MFLPSIEYFLLVPINNHQRQIQQQSNQSQVPINQCNILLSGRSTLPNANFRSRVNTVLQNEDNFLENGENRVNLFNQNNEKNFGESSSNNIEKTDQSLASHQPSTSSAIVNSSNILYNQEFCNLMTSDIYTNYNLNITNKRLLFELEQLEKFSISGCQAQPQEHSILHWTVVIEGPANTVYEDGTFFVNLVFNSNYPFIAPKISFLTRIYHCNINSQGKVCIDSISKDWNSCMTISTILQSLMSLLYACNPYDALVPSIAEQYLKNRSEFEKIARIWTRRYAQ